MAKSIASYYARVGVDIDPSGIKKVDAYLKRIEARMQRSLNSTKNKLKVPALEINRFTVDRERLNKAITFALNNASRQTVFQVTRFNVDKIALQRAIDRASRGMAITPRLTPLPNTQRTVSNNLQQVPAQTQVAPPQQRQRTVGGRAGFLGLGLRTGPLTAVGAVYGGARAVGAGNRANQEIMSAQLTTQAVTEAGGAHGQGTKAFEWLKSEGNRIGFNYMEQVQDYNSLLANVMGSGLTLSQGQDVFQGFSEYGRAMGITPYRQKLVLTAASQMFG